MAYDEDLAFRIREQLTAEPNVTETRMFGGLAFLINGNMAIGASRNGGVLVRVDPAESESIQAKTKARPMEMRGRSTTGWLYVDAEHVRTRPQVAKWVKVGAGYARTLPAKKSKKR